MSQPELEALDRMEEERGRSYERFENYGDDFIDVMLSGVPELDDTWISAEQILEASDREKAGFKEEGGNRIFTSIYNLLCHTEILPAFHNSAPYEIHRENYESEPVIEAWEHVSGEEYTRPEDRHDRPQAPDPDTDDLYEDLKR